MLDRLLRYFNKRLLSPTRWLQSRVKQSSTKLIRLGSPYGGWWLADHPSLKGGLCLCCGAGEDISFDIQLQAKLGSRVVIADPTPRAIEHFRGVKRAILQGKEFNTNGNGEKYDFRGLDIESIKFVPIAAWDCSAELDFFAPANPSHVSYSAVNLQKTAAKISVPAMAIRDLLVGEIEESAGGLALLKLDIEGAEARVIRDLTGNGPLPLQILVELDEVHFPTLARINDLKKLVLEIENAGYDLIHYDGDGNCSFILRDLQVTLN